MGAVIAFIVTVVVFSFLSPGASSEPPDAGTASADAGIAMPSPRVNEVRFVKPGLAIQPMSKRQMLSDDAQLPDAATP